MASGGKIPPLCPAFSELLTCALLVQSRIALGRADSAACLRLPVLSVGLIPGLLDAGTWTSPPQWPFSQQVQQELPQQVAGLSQPRPRSREALTTPA